MDATEGIRKLMVAGINSQVQSESEDTERTRLEAQHGQVWDTKELQQDFSVTGFMAPFVGVTRRSDSKKGAMMFQHHPRFYLDFTPEG